MSAAQLMSTIMTETQYLPTAEVSVSVEKLTNQDRTEVLAFLAERPIHTVVWPALSATTNLRAHSIVAPFTVAVIPKVDLKEWP